MADFLSMQTLQALGFVGGMVGTAIGLSNICLPKKSNFKTRFIFIWLTFDSICHLVLEGSFLYFSTFGRTVNKSKHFLAYLWQDYAVADSRWGIADSTVVSLELLTVLGEGPLAGFCAYLITKNNSSYHFWVVILSIGELYGGFMTFAPEWLTQNKNLNGSTFLLMWVYLVFMNMVWVIIPIYLIGDSYNHIIRTLKAGGARPLDGWRSSKKTKSK